MTYSNQYSLGTANVTSLKSKTLCSPARTFVRFHLQYCGIFGQILVGLVSSFIMQVSARQAPDILVLVVPETLGA